MKRILFICTKYSLDPEDPYLTNDLINYFTKLGNEATILAIGDITRNPNNEARKNELVFPLGSQKKYFKYLILWPKVIKTILFELRKKRDYDLCITFAPLAVIAPVILMLNLFKIKNKKCIIFDLFPIHQIQLKIINKKIGFIFYFIERYLLSTFDCVTGMSPANVQAIKEYYKLRINHQVLYLWGVKENVKLMPPKGSSDEIKMVFGGQIIPGRSVEQLIELVKILVQQELLITLTIYSHGQNFEKLKSKYADFKNVIFENRISRSKYLETLSYYDVGVIITDPRVKLPTFPSKIIDYINCGIPSLCLIEKYSDIQGVISDSKFLHVNHFDFNDNSIVDIKNFLIESKNYLHHNLSSFSKFHVQTAATEILKN